MKRAKIVSGCKKVCVEMINNIEMLLQINNDNIYDYGANNQSTYGTCMELCY